MGTEPRWVRPLWRLLGSPRGADLAMRRFVAFCAVTCLLGAVVLAWVDKRYDPVVEVPALDVVLWGIGLKTTWEYFRLRKEGATKP